MMQNKEFAMVAMPRYQCHKKVWALKIKKIQVHGRDETYSDAGATITPEEEGYGDFEVSYAWVYKHQPKVGGYYICYEDGYASFSPAGPFEEGYTRI